MMDTKSLKATSDLRYSYQVINHPKVIMTQSLQAKICMISKMNDHNKPEVHKLIHFSANNGEVCGTTKSFTGP